MVSALFIYLVGVNRHVESFVVCIVGKMAQDVMV